MAMIYFFFGGGVRKDEAATTTFGFSALGLRTSLLDFFWPLAMTVSFDNNWNGGRVKSRAFGGLWQPAAALGQDGRPIQAASQV